MPITMWLLTYKFDLTQPNKYDREGKLVNPDASRVRDLGLSRKTLLIWTTFLVVTNNYRATGNFPGVKDAEKRLLNLRESSPSLTILLSENITNPTVDGNGVSYLIHECRYSFCSSDNARAHSCWSDAISYVGWRRTKNETKTRA